MKTIPCVLFEVVATVVLFVLFVISLIGRAAHETGSRIVDKMNAVEDWAQQ